MKASRAIEVLKQNYPKRCYLVHGRLLGGFDNKDCELGQAITTAIEALEKNADTPEVTAEVKRDCILYRAEKRDCKGLKKLYCACEDCGFYKSREQYNQDGTKRKQIRT